MRALPFVLAGLLLASCARHGGDRGPEPMRAVKDAAAIERCQALFPQGRMQLVHTIAFRMAHGEHGNALGVLVLNGPEIECALMTVEGFTLFSARSSGPDDLRIDRAVPPFDNRDFAAGLMRDVRLLFRPPEGAPAAGVLPDGATVCRFQARDRLVDLLPHADGGWELQEFTGQSVLRVDGCLSETRETRWREARSVDATPPRAQGPANLAAAMDLTAPGPAGYTLNLRLLEAVPLPDISQP